MEQKTYEQVLASIDPQKAARAIANSVIYLGGLTDWGADEFEAVQGQLSLALEGSGLPHFGDQDDETFRFWGTLSLAVGNDCDYEPVRYVAIQNVPGYLGMDDDPPTFETPAEAWDYLAGLRRDSEDHAFETSEDVAEGYSATLNVLEALAHGDFENDWGTDPQGLGSVVGPTPGYDGDHDLGLAYSVSIVEED